MKVRISHSIELEEIPLSYLPSGAVRLHVKAVGDLF